MMWPERDDDQKTLPRRRPNDMEDGSLAGMASVDETEAGVAAVGLGLGLGLGAGVDVGISASVMPGAFSETDETENNQLKAIVVYSEGLYAVNRGLNGLGHAGQTKNRGPREPGVCSVLGHAQELGVSMDAHQTGWDR